MAAATPLWAKAESQIDFSLAAVAFPADRHHAGLGQTSFCGKTDVMIQYAEVLRFITTAPSSTMPRAASNHHWHHRALKPPVFAHLSCASWKNLKEKRLFSGCHECCWVQIVCHSHHHNLCSRDSPRTWDQARYIISTYFKQQHSWKMQKKEDGRNRVLERMNSRPQTCLFNILLKHWRNCVQTFHSDSPICHVCPRSTSEISFATAFAWHLHQWP